MNIARVVRLLHLVWMLSALCLLTPAVASAGPPGFYVINNSADTIAVAYGWRDRHSGAFAPPVWKAKGWWSVAPYSSKLVYSSNDTGKMYFRLQRNGTTIVPRNNQESAEFCVASSRFVSSEADAAGPYQFSLATGSNGDGGYAWSGQGASCESLGGEFRTFYYMSIQTDFTIN